MLSIEISSPVYPSEDLDKVRTAILRIFPDAVIDGTDTGLSASSESIDTFSKKIRKQKILDTTRSVLIRGQRGNVTRFFLNKQVAFVGKISFCEERTILGTIKVVMESDDMDGLIDRVSPVTVDGEEVIL